MSASGPRRFEVAALVAAVIFMVAAAGVAQDAGPSDAGPAEGDASAGDASAESDAAPARPAKRNERPIPPGRLPRIEAKLGAEEVELGERLELRIEVFAQQDDRVHLRDATEIDPFEIIGRNRTALDESDGSEQPSEVIQLDLITFEVGRLEVPPIELLVVLDDGRTGSVSTPALPVRVTDPLGNEVDPAPRGDHPPRPVMTTDRRALWVMGVIGAMLLAALIGAVIGRLRARRKPAAGPPPPPPRPAEEVALEKLDAVRESDMLEQGEIKLFHITVSEAVREYLGARHGFESLELTTDEMMEHLREVELKGVTETELIEFLRETDMVKFAKWRPEIERCREMLERAYDIVHRTTEAVRAEEIRQEREHRREASRPESAPPKREGGDDAS